MYYSQRGKYRHDTTEEEDDQIIHIYPLWFKSLCIQQNWYDYALMHMGNTSEGGGGQLYVLLNSAEYDQQDVGASESGLCWLTRGQVQSQSVGREIIWVTREEHF